MSNPTITVLMSVYNEPNIWLSKSVESILNQTFKDFEFIIMIDNPNNMRICKLINEYSLKDERLRFYINENNLGLPNSLNKGITLSAGKYIARMDADDISICNRLELQIKYIETMDADICGGQFICIDKNDNIISDKSEFPNECNDVYNVLKYENCVPHPTWMVKREVYDTLKGYRNFKAIEDIDFLLRSKSKKYKIVNTINLLLYYRINEESISNRNEIFQFLQTKYLCDNIQRIENVTAQELHCKIVNKFNENDIKNYQIGKEYLNRSFSENKIKNKLLAAFYLKKYLYFKLKIKYWNIIGDNNE